MKTKCIVVILLLGMSMTWVSALEPDSLQISIDREWVVAGSGEMAQVTVKVFNNSDPLSSVSVNLWCEAEIMGTISPPSRITDAGGTFTVSFKPNTTSGDANICAAVTSNSSIRDCRIIKIDHAEPKKWSMLSYPASAPINSNVTLTVRLNDTYNNIVENRRYAENITFQSSTTGSNGFWDGSDWVKKIVVPVGADGHATAVFRTDSIAGSNVIRINAPPTVLYDTQWITIQGIAVTPAYIASIVEPSPPLVYANNRDVFTITYRVTDTLGNPVPNVYVWRNTTLGESDRFITNSEGVVVTTYGPKKSIGKVTITAMVEGHPEIHVVNMVEFVSSEPVMWELTASPQTLASRDVREDITADIKAKVMDVLGNPVMNESVAFSIVNVTNSTRLNLTPELVSTMAETDVDGFAVVQLRPGAFPVWGEEDYNATATGTATVRATWNGRTKEIVITFKNYPYLRVETSVSPQTVKVNEPIDVTIRLIGDGWALRPKPIDVMLVTDRSGSMLKDEPIDRMIPVKNASKEFARQMDLSQSQDHVGLISFGISGIAKIAPNWTGYWNWNNIYGGQNGALSGSGWWWVSKDRDYECNRSSYSSSSDHHQYVVRYYNNGNPKLYSNYAVVDVPLNWSPSAINNSIDTMVPTGGTPMRYAVYRAIKEMNSSARNNAVRALIVLSDGDYNWFGDPLARDPNKWKTSGNESYSDLDTYWYKFQDLLDDEQNLSRYAIKNNIVIYSIGYAADITAGGRNTLRILAESTGGKYYDGNAANIEDIYRKIAGELKDVAGVDTKMNLSFLEINRTYENVTYRVNGTEVFEYQYNATSSTYITSWNSTRNPLPGYPITIDQTADWSGNRLDFDVGNISINQTWQATFRLIPLKEGSISIFGPGSNVSFNGAEGRYSTLLPDTFVTVIGSMSEEIGTQALVDVNITGISGSGMVDLTWVLTYNGTRAVKQDISYRFSKDHVLWSDWISAGSHYIVPDVIGGPYGDQELIDIRGETAWPMYRVIDCSENISEEEKGYIKFKVYAKELPNGDDDQDERDACVQFVFGLIKIT